MMPVIDARFLGTLGLAVLGLAAAGAAVFVAFLLADLPPVAEDDTATTPRNTPVLIDVLANDSDPDLGDVLSIAPSTSASS